MWTQLHGILQDWRGFQRSPTCVFVLVPLQTRLRVHPRSFLSSRARIAQKILKSKIKESIEQYPGEVYLPVNLFKYTKHRPTVLEGPYPSASNRKPRKKARDAAEDSTNYVITYRLC
jgi:hypothetical protein